MANKTFDSFKDLRKGKYDWKVQARVLNLWRGYNKNKEPFKWFNLLLVDSKRSRVHAFVPQKIADTVEQMLEVGKVYLFKNFTVKEYKEEDKFRCILHDIQIVFSAETKINELDENDVSIERAVFDFYDLGDLKDLSKQTTYLTDVVGVIKNTDLTLAKFKNRLQQSQTQMNFEITDGIHDTKVTFWDAFAEEFEEAIKQDLEYPLIIISGCGRVSQWQGEVDISNVGATTFHLNSNHHSVYHMRQMLQEPQFENYRTSKSNNATPQILQIKQIKDHFEDKAEKEIICHLNLKHLHGTKEWFKNICTSCYKETTFSNDVNRCTCGPRDVLYPMKWFYISATCEDVTGVVDVILNNVAGQKCLMRDVYDIIEEDEGKFFPDKLRVIENKKYWMKLLIKEENYSGKSNTYFAIDIIEGMVMDKIIASDREIIDNQKQPRPLEEYYNEGSKSNYHIESMSEDN